MATVPRNTILPGHVLDRLAELPADSIHCVVTSPPYWGLRAYGTDPVPWGDGWQGEYGSEPTPGQYVAHTVEVFEAVRRVLRPDGQLWLNIGDSYAGYHGNSRVPDDEAPSNRPGYIENMRQSTVGIAGLKPKDLVGIPWQVALALRDAGWWLRDDIIWAKPNPMPSSVQDRTTKSHEYLFLLTKSPRYFFDHVAIQEPAKPSSIKQQRRGFRHSDRDNHYRKGCMDSPGFEKHTRNRRSVWTIPTEPHKEAHFATFPVKLVVPCLLAGTSERGCCPECGAPWRRVIRKERVRTRPGEDSKTIDREHDEIGNRDPGRHVTRYTTTGWSKSCDCGGNEVQPPEPAIVLDPFLGSGTTAVAAKWLGRHWLGIELNAEYREIARKRIAQGYQKGGLRKPDVRGQKHLF